MSACIFAAHTAEADAPKWLVVDATHVDARHAAADLLQKRLPSVSGARPEAAGRRVGRIQ
jgi:hypothetical protein